MLAILFAAAIARAYAPTPQAAALQAVYDQRAVPFVRRVNLVGRFATVLIGAGMMEGSDLTEPILVERFSFGWQPLVILGESCSLYGHIFDAETIGELMAGMPKLKIEQRACSRIADVGAVADVEGVRKQMLGPLVPRVTVAGNWAIAEWYGAGGGQDLFERTLRSWKFITGGCGTIGVNEMRHYGVPQSVWCGLRVYNARCSGSR